MDVKNPVSQSKILENQYKNWKMEVGPLYDYLMVECMTWPSLTVQWFPINEV